MAKLDDFDVFGGATTPVAPSAQQPPTPAPAETPETPAETPPAAPAPKETQTAPKRRQGAAQRRAGGITTGTPPAPEPEPAPEPDPEPEPEADDEPILPPLTRAQEGRWELLLQSAAGKTRKTREAAREAHANFVELVADARKAGVSEWSIQAAALRGRIDLDEPAP